MNDNILLSSGFRADVSIIAIKTWVLIAIYAYTAILFNIDTSKLSITSPELIISLIVILGTTFRFLTFSKDWQPYFEEFEKWPKRKNLIGGIIVWGIIVLIFINIFISVELMKKLR